MTLNDANVSQCLLNVLVGNRDLLPPSGHRIN